MSSIVGYDISKHNLFSNELGLNNYKSVANKVDFLLVSEEQKDKINIELNRNYSKYLVHKNDSYIYKLAGEFYAGLENKYTEEINVKQINLNNFYNHDNKNIPMNYFIVHDPINNLVKEGIKIYDMYLPKIKEMCYNCNEELYKDLAMFEVNNYEEMAQLAKYNKEREAVMEDLKKLGSDTEFTDLYDHEEFERLKHKYELEDAHNEGRAEGLKEAQKENINNMLEFGISKEDIASILKITLEEVEENLS